MLAEIRAAVRQGRLTVLVTHWWEFYRNAEPDPGFIRVLHETADFLASEGDVRVVSFEDVALGKVPLD
jgi:hypothetical protein